MTKKGKDKPKTKYEKAGAPTKYKPEYCEMLKQHMGQGLSVESFAGKIKVHKDSIYEWAKVHREFSDSINIGRSMSLLFFEQVGNAGMVGKIKGFNATAWIFNMKNKHAWRDNADDRGDDSQREYEKVLREALAEIGEDL